MGAAGATRAEAEVGKAEMKPPITGTQATPEAPQSLHGPAGEDARGAGGSTSSTATSTRSRT